MFIVFLAGLVTGTMVGVIAMAIFCVAIDSFGGEQ